MSIEILIRALRLPAGAVVDQRIPKKLLVEQAARTAADKRLINDSVDELLWHAALKPATIGVAAFAGSAFDASDAVIEVAVVSVVLRSGVSEVAAEQLRQSIHRAIPYPLMLVAQRGGGVRLLLATERASLAKAGKVVVQTRYESQAFDPLAPSPIERDFLAGLGIDDQPRTDLAALYQGYIDRVTALRAARITGAYSATRSASAGEAQREAFAEHERLSAGIAAVRTLAAKERQLARRVELNLRLQRLHTELRNAEARLTASPPTPTTATP